jgi:diacylglycerol kinase family enzyme
MGIIPRGTANAFSVALGIPTHLDDPINFAKQAAEVILQVGHACIAVVMHRHLHYGGVRFCSRTAQRASLQQSNRCNLALAAL